MTEYVIDWNAGPGPQYRTGTPAELRSYMESMIPLVTRRGYSHTWSRRGAWHVIEISNSKGRPVHAAAFRPRLST